MSITYSEFVFVALFIQHAVRMLSIVIRGLLRLYIIFPCYFTNGTIFEGGGWLNITLLKPTGHVMYQQFNIQQLYALHTLYLCVLYLSENKQRLVPLTA